LVLAARAEWQLYHLRRDLVEAEQKRQALVQQRQSLEKECARLKDPAYLEGVAREELGLVRPGEVLVLPGDRLQRP
ncbi:MAG: septum formation initiator family protein, partial [Clostridia bacterium]|nr:septum formation initiator family protein [Clostridia bacterium]